MSTVNGFNEQSVCVSSSPLAHAVVAALALGSLSLCLVVTFTVLSIGASLATPFAG